MFTISFILFHSAPATTPMIAVAKALDTLKLVLKIKIKLLGKKLWPNRESVNAIFQDVVSLIDLKVRWLCGP